MGDRPKVVRVISYLNVGGVEKRLLAVLKELKDDFDCEVVCIHSRGPLAERFEEAGIPVTTIPFKGRFHPESLLRLAFHLIKCKAMVVHSHMYRPNASATVSALLAQVPVVVANIHNLGHWDSTRQKRTDALLAPFRSHTVTVSREVWREYLTETGADPERTSVVHNGVPADTGHQPPENILNELGIPSYSLVVSCVARLVPQKGLPILLDGWKGVESRVSNAWLLVVGGGPLQEELKAAAREQGLSRVVFTGVRDDVERILRSSACLVLTSLKEGFSNVILEAMSVATPPVVTRVGGAEEAVVHKETGLLMPSGNSGAARNSMLLILSNPRMRIRMGLKARQRQTRLFSIQEMARATSYLYRRLLGLKAGARGVK